MSEDAIATAADGAAGGHWLGIIGCWTVMGLIESCKAYVSGKVHGTPVALRAALIGNMPWWWFWALATPLIFRIADRFPLGDARGRRFLPVHLLSAVLFTMLHIALIGGLYYQTSARGHVPGYGFMVQRWIESFSMLNFVTYWAIVGVHHALVYNSRLRLSQLNAARLEVQAAQLQASMTEARLNALRMELHPHFLFNTLNAIAGLVRRQEDDAAVRVLARLGDLLRITLDREAAQKVPLEEELHFLEQYLGIERIRFRDRLEVAIDVDDDTLGLLVPTLVLQPLVENAVRHGIARKPGAGHIRIRAQQTSGALLLEVSDSGIGFPDGGPAREGVGLSNTRARLEQLYSSGSTSLSFANNEHGGATVRLRLPLEAPPVSESLAGPPSRAALALERR